MFYSQLGNQNTAVKTVKNCLFTAYLIQNMHGCLPQNIWKQVCCGFENYRECSWTWKTEFWSWSSLGYWKPTQGHPTLNLSLGGDKSPGTCLKPAHTQAHREGTVWLGLCVTEMSKERAGEAGQATGSAAMAHALMHSTVALRTTAWALAICCVSTQSSPTRSPRVWGGHSGRLE